jgi:hypothetical protein
MGLGLIGRSKEVHRRTRREIRKIKIGEIIRSQNAPPLLKEEGTFFLFQYVCPLPGRERVG